MICEQHSTPEPGCAACDREQAIVEVARKTELDVHDMRTGEPLSGPRARDSGEDGEAREKFCVRCDTWVSPNGHECNLLRSGETPAQRLERVVGMPSLPMMTDVQHEIIAAVISEAGHGVAPDPVPLLQMHVRLAAHHVREAMRLRAGVAT